MKFEFVSANGRVRYEAKSLSELCRLIRQHEPCSTRFKAIEYFDRVLSRKAFNVISLSPHTIGPNFVGRICSESV